MRKLTMLLLAVVVSASFACKKNEPPPPPAPAPMETMTPAATIPPEPAAVGTVTLGNAIGADKKVTTPSESFAAKDTIYASIDTTGQGHVKLRALWSYMKGGKTAKVDEQNLEFDSIGPATNEFHVAKPSGWPKGDYQVEIFLGDDAAPVATKTFKVQ
jgi:hypothetical protein